MGFDITVYQYLNKDLIEANKFEANKIESSQKAAPSVNVQETTSNSPSFSETYDLAKQAVQAIDIDSALKALKEAGGTGINMNSKLAYDLGVVASYAYLENQKQNLGSTVDVTLKGASCLNMPVNYTTLCPSHTGTSGYDNSGVLKCPDYMQKYFEEAAELTGLDIKLIKAVAIRESDFSQSEVSSTGAIGVMQLMPDCSIDVGVTDATDLEQNILGGATELAANLNYYKGDLELALAAYNTGRGNVKKYGNTVPSYCQKYVKDIINYYNS